MKRHRHTLERRNAPYRGMSTQEDFVLPYTKAVRDLTRLLYIAGQEGHRAQTDALTDRLVAGRDGEMRNSILATGKMVRVEPATWGQALTDWEKVGGATTSSAGRGVVLSELGLLDPAGITLRVPVEAGQVLWVSFFVKKVSGDVSDFAFGATRMNGNERDMRQVDLSEETDGVWVDKRLYCREREELELSLLLHEQPTSLSAGAVHIEDFEWGFAVESETPLVGYDHVKDTELRRVRRRTDAIERGGR